MRGWLPWLALAVVVGVALGIGSTGDGGPRTDAERVADVAASLRCPTCRGQSVLESDAPAADAIRSDIARRVEAGQSDAEIRDALVAAYGEDVLLNPPRSGIAGLVWVLPVAALVAAAAGLVVAFRRWRPSSAEADAGDRALVEEARRRSSGPRGPESP